MAENTTIEWCDSSWNPWIGCTKVGPGCDNCYAEADFDLRKHRVKWGAGNPRSRTSPANWKKPLQWNAKPFYECRCCGWRGDASDAEFSTPRQGCIHDLAPARRRVFSASLSDVFDNEVPREWRYDLLWLISNTQNLDWLLLTKRIGNAHRMLTDECLRTGFPWGPERWPHVWLGATICNQEEADRDIHKLLAVPAAVRWLSMEPLLGPVDIRQYLQHNPVYDKTENERGVCVPSGVEWRSGNTAGRDDLASTQTRVGPLEENSGESSVQAGARGTRYGGLLPNSDHGGQGPGLCGGAPFGVAPLQRADPSRTDDQSQGRQEEAECSGQFRIGDIRGTTNSRGSRSEGGACVQSELREKLDDKTAPRSSDGDSQEACGWGEVAGNSGGLRDRVSDGIENSQRRQLGGILWAVVGGESGPKARPMHPAWARSLRDQCAAAGIAFLHKQNGAWADADAPGVDMLGTERSQMHKWPDGTYSVRIGKKLAGRLLDGIEHNGYPEARP